MGILRVLIWRRRGGQRLLGLGNAVSIVGMRGLGGSVEVWLDMTLVNVFADSLGFRFVSR